MTKKIDRARLPGIACPHCGSKTVTRDSQQVTVAVRELRIVCQNDDCGFSAVAQLSFIKTIRPAARPNAEVRLPFGDWSRPANDDQPAPANDDHGLGLALAGVMTT